MGTRGASARESSRICSCKRCHAHKHKHTHTQYAYEFMYACVFIHACMCAKYMCCLNLRVTHLGYCCLLSLDLPPCKFVVSAQLAFHTKLHLIDHKKYVERSSWHTHKDLCGGLAEQQAVGAQEASTLPAHKRQARCRRTRGKHAAGAQEASTLPAHKRQARCRRR
jgi:hypothetical protein